MTQFSCVGVESNEARSLCGLTAGAQGHNRSSDLTQGRSKLPASSLQTFTRDSRNIGYFKAALQSLHTAIDDFIWPLLLKNNCPSLCNTIWAQNTLCSLAEGLWEADVKGWKQLVHLWDHSGLGDHDPDYVYQHVNYPMRTATGIASTENMRQWHLDMQYAIALSYYELQKYTTNG